MSTNSQSPISEKELRETYELLPKEKLIDALVNLHKELRTSRPEQPRELPTDEEQAAIKFICDNPEREDFLEDCRQKDVENNVMNMEQAEEKSCVRQGFIKGAGIYDSNRKADLIEGAKAMQSGTIREWVKNQK